MDRIKPWALPGAVLVAGLSVAVALLFGHRFTAISSANVLWVTDSLTGHVTQCRYPTADTGGEAGCLELRAPRTLTDAEVGLKPDLSAWSKPKK